MSTEEIMTMSRYIDADRLLTERMKSKYYHLPNGDTAIPIIDIEHAPTIITKEIKYFDDDEKIWKIGRVIVDV